MSNGNPLIGRGYFQVGYNIGGGIQKLCGNLVKYLPFVWNPLGRITSNAESVGYNHYQELVVDVVNIAYFPMVHWNLGGEFKIGAGDCFILGDYLVWFSSLSASVCLSGLPEASSYAFSNVFYKFMANNIAVSKLNMANFLYSSVIYWFWPDRIVLFGQVDLCNIACKQWIFALLPCGLETFFSWFRVVFCASSRIKGIIERATRLYASGAIWTVPSSINSSSFLGGIICGGHRTGAEGMDRVFPSYHR